MRVIGDAVKQSSGRWQAIVRRLDGEVVWISSRICHTKRAAIVEAIHEAGRACYVINDCECCHEQPRAKGFKVCEDCAAEAIDDIAAGRY